MWYHAGMTTPSLTMTSEQINSLPLLLGILNDLGIRDLIDTHIQPHGLWQGASLGTLVCIWLSHMLLERDHCMVTVRDWAADRATTINSLLGISLRQTDCTDDRLAQVLSLLGQPQLQATLDQALTQRWLRVYRLPTHTLRLDSTSVSLYHQPESPDSLLQFGQSKDHRPDLRQFKLMLASLDPLGLPLVCPVVAGNQADDGLYVPTYEAAVAALGTRNVLVVGDSKMAARAIRGHLVAQHSCYLSAYRPPSATAELAGWIDDALAHPERCQRLETLDRQTGEITLDALVDLRTREQSWLDPASQQTHIWSERVLVLQSPLYQAGKRRRLEQRLTRLTERLLPLMQPPTRGRTRYVSEAALAVVVSKRISEAKLDQIVQVRLSEVRLATGTTGWVLARLWVDLAAWQARVARLGWQVYVTNTSAEQYDLAALVGEYRHQAVQERGFSRLKTRNLQLRPVYVRDERRICGLVWLLCLALRVLVITEQRVRAALAAQQQEIAGLNPASRNQTTARPTTERIIRVFSNITLTQIEQNGACHRHVSGLSATQQQLLGLLGLPADLYARLGAPSPNSLPHLRE